MALCQATDSAVKRENMKFCTKQKSLCSEINTKHSTESERHVEFFNV